MLRDIFLPLISGAALFLPDKGYELESLELLGWIEENKITLIHTIPSMIRLWLIDIPQKVELTSLRYLFLSGEPLTSTLIEQWRKAFPRAGKIVNFYGPTETTLIKFYYEIPEKISSGIQPVDSPLPETQALLFNEAGQLCGFYEPGEIAIRTPFRTRGYINAPEENAHSFRLNPYRADPDDILYYTGDIGMWHADGRLQILGRKDNQIKISGVRMELEEIEAQIQRHPAVRHAFVAAKTHPDQQKSLRAFIVPRDRFEVGALRSFLAQSLPAVMIPAAFTCLDALPLLPNGKVDRQKLIAAELPAAEAPSAKRAGQSHQDLITDIWKEVLGREDIGADENFYELGGHSLLANRILLKIRKETGVKITLREMFACPTVNGMVCLIEKAAPMGLKKAVSRFSDERLIEI
jgi:acyl-coenzyme A synthetase/AMP-(fatty) acid ligase/acyl carrier protein